MKSAIFLTSYEYTPAEAGHELCLTKEAWNMMANMGQTHSSRPMGSLTPRNAMLFAEALRTGIRAMERAAASKRPANRPGLTPADARAEFFALPENRAALDAVIGFCERGHGVHINERWVSS